MLAAIDEGQYLKERLEDQILWYDKKSLLNQRMYKLLTSAELVLSASIPVALTVAPNDSCVRFLVGLAGAAIAVMRGIQGLCSFHENWMQYRVTCEALKREKYMYLTRSGIYCETDNPFALLVERTEQIVSRENACWMQIQGKTNQDRSGEPGLSSLTGS